MATIRILDFVFVAWSVLCSFVFINLIRPAAKLEIVLERHADEGGDGIGKFLGEFGGGGFVVARRILCEQGGG